jgi:long-chain acyl-CoA synthetase
MDLKILDENGVKQAAGEKGEIVVRGENVMAGYWKNPKATAEAIRDGWLYTGDIGYLGKDGLLYVLGRLKSLLISSDGEKYSPEGMEEALSEKSPFIDQVILYNNQNPYISALIVPNKEKIKQHFEQHRFHSDEERTTAYIKLIQDEIAKYKKHGIFAGEFPERWLPSTFTLLGEAFTEQNGFVNSTMKIIRGKVEEFHKGRIEFMYTSEGKDVFNEQNRIVF